MSDFVIDVISRRLRQRPAPLLPSSPTGWRRFGVGPFPSTFFGRWIHQKSHRRPSEGFLRFWRNFSLFFYRFVDFRGKNKMATVATKQRLQCASRSLHRGNRSTTSRRKHKMWTHRTRRSSRQIARQNQQNGGGFFLKNGRNRFVFFFVGRWKRGWMGPLNGQAIGTSLWSTTPKSAIFHFCRQVQRFFNYIKLATDDPAVASGRIKSGSALLYIPSRSWPGVCISLQNFR